MINPRQEVQLWKRRQDVIILRTRNTIVRPSQINQHTICHRRHCRLLMQGNLRLRAQHNRVPQKLQPVGVPSRASIVVPDLALDEVGSREGAVDFEAAVGADPGRVQHKAEVVQHGADSVYFEVDGLLQRGVVADDERAEEPGPHDVVEEEVVAVLPGHGLGGAYAGDKGISD